MDKGGVEGERRGMKKKPWDRIAQTLYECCNSALIGLKREEYISLDEYEFLIHAIQARIEEPKD